MYLSSDPFFRIHRDCTSYARETCRQVAALPASALFPDPTDWVPHPCAFFFAQGWETTDLTGNQLHFLRPGLPIHSPQRRTIKMSHKSTDPAPRQFAVIAKSVTKHALPKTHQPDISRSHTMGQESSFSVRSTTSFAAFASADSMASRSAIRRSTMRFNSARTTSSSGDVKFPSNCSSAARREWIAPEEKRETIKVSTMQNLAEFVVFGKQDDMYYHPPDTIHSTSRSRAERHSTGFLRLRFSTRRILANQLHLSLGS
jgi:hypothetical protein